MITVLITTHNYGRFIEQAIDSVLSQEFPLDEVQVLVVDDGSTDDTSERVKKYGSRIEYFYKPNGGQASALNFGIVKARGEIIALLDADDFFLPGKLAHVAEAFQRDPALGMVYHRLQQWNMQADERRDYKFIPISGDLRAMPGQFLLYDPQPTSAVSFRRASLNPLLPIPEDIRMLADAFLVNLVPFLSPILAVPESLGVYRIHGKNHFFVDERQMPLEARSARLQKWQIVIDGMSKWLARNGHARKQPPVRAFLNRWTMYQKRERFLMKSPGRLHFFWFVVWENYVASPVQARKLTVFNYICTPLALVLGYSRADQFYKWRGETMKAIERFLRAFVPVRP